MPATEPAPQGGPRDPLDLAIQVGALAALILGAAVIVKPFATVLLWSALLAVLLQPLHKRLSPRLGNGRAAALIGVVSVLLLLGPTIFAANATAASTLDLAQSLKAGTLDVGPPPAKLASIPLVGGKLTQAWSDADRDIPAALVKYSSVIKPAVNKLGALAGGLAASVLSFALSLGIAAAFIAYGDSLLGIVRDVAQRIEKDPIRVERQMALATSTIRSVAIGVVGVAVIQAGLLAIGLFVAGVPFAGLLTLVILLLGIVQVPALLVSIPVIAWGFATQDSLTAIGLAIWMLVAGSSDNVLKPILLGRGLNVPMPVILIGVIGGMVADGLVGLFLGPVLLAILWVLMMEWARPGEMAVEA